jgi:hypothetical protein
VLITIPGALFVRSQDAIFGIRQHRRLLADMARPAFGFRS